MQPQSKTDAELIVMIQDGGKTRLTAIDFIYANRIIKQKILNYVRKMGGDQHEALDVFHESIIAVDKNIRLNRFKQETSIEGYLFSIARNTWNNMWRKKSKTSGNEIRSQQMKSDHQPDSDLVSEERKNYLRQLLDLLDQPCKKILLLWKASYSMAEIAEKCDLSSQAIAKKYRYRCMKKLMAQLENNQPLKEILRHV